MFDRLIPFLSSLVILAGWELLIYFPKHFTLTIAVVFVIFLILLLKLNKFRVKDRDFWLLLTPGLSLIIFNTVFLLFLSHRLLQQIIIILVTIVIYFFVSYLYYFLCRITSYTPLSLERLSSYFSVVGYFFLATSAYGFINLLSLKVWQAALAIIIFNFIMAFQFFWINKIAERQNLFACIILSILMAEFFWSISFLPVSHFISGFALAIIYYAVVNLSLAHFLEKLDKKIVRWYLSIGLICLFVILLSARWL